MYKATCIVTLEGRNEPMKAMEPIWTNIMFYWTGLWASFNKEDSSFCQGFIILLLSQTLELLQN
jgi:hypothetical protein